MELTRVIHPIGQGGFYTETFTEAGKEVFNVVYDCGSGTAAPKSIISYLEKYYPNSPKKDIDAVFISHLHEDHINGLARLLEITTVKRLFLPQLTDDVLLEALLHNCINATKGKSSVNDFLLSIYRNSSNERDLQIIQIRPEENGDSIENDRIGDNARNNFVDLEGTLENSYGADTIFRYKQWLYIPFNSPAKPLKQGSFYDYMKNNVNKGKDFQLKDIGEIYEHDSQSCKKAYEEYFGKDHNSYSMTLFSGMEDPDLFHHCLKPCRCKHNVCPKDCDCLCRNYSPNFLYTGDFEPNKSDQNNVKYVDKLMQSLKSMNLWHTIRGVQVPHHGSRNNFSSELYKNRCVGYISAGSHNQFHHPNVDTLVNIQKQGCRPIVVSEDLSSMQVEVYKI